MRRRSQAPARFQSASILRWSGDVCGSRARGKVAGDEWQESDGERGAAAFASGSGLGLEGVAGRILFVEADLHLLRVAGDERDARVGGGDGQKASAPVDENGEFDAGG